MPIIYLIQPAKYNKTSIYKVGCSRDSSQRRINEYGSNTKILIIVHFNDIENIFKHEKNIINIFKSQFRLAEGREWFEGNCTAMAKIIYDYKINNDNIFDNNDKLYYNVYTPDDEKMDICETPEPLLRNYNSQIYNINEIINMYSIFNFSVNIDHNYKELCNKIFNHIIYYENKIEMNDEIYNNIIKVIITDKNYFYTDMQLLYEIIIIFYDNYFITDNQQYTKDNQQYINVKQIYILINEIIKCKNYTLIKLMNDKLGSY